MENQTPPRKKWSERQFDLFAEAAKEFGRGASKDDFERVVDQILPSQDERRKPRRARRNAGKEGE
jgi:hypothetical protein